MTWPDIFQWIILPLLIFGARVVDVSLGTLRIIYIARERRWLATLFGFVEVLVWLVAISQIFKDNTNFVCFVGYAAGYAIGNFVGVKVAGMVSRGTVGVRLITQKDAGPLIAHLRGRGLGVTVVDGHGAQGPVDVLFIVVRKRDLDSLVADIAEMNPRAFYTVEDIRAVSHGVFPGMLSTVPGPDVMPPGVRR